MIGGPAKRMGGGPEPGEDILLEPFIKANIAGGRGGRLGPAVGGPCGGRI